MDNRAPNDFPCPRATVPRNVHQAGLSKRVDSGLKSCRRNAAARRASRGEGAPRGACCALYGLRSVAPASPQGGARFLPIWGVTFGDH